MTENSFFAMTTVGPRDSIWTGTPFRLSIYRSKTPMAPPRKVCRDVEAPALEQLRLRGRVTVRAVDAAGNRAVVRVRQS